MEQAAIPSAWLSLTNTWSAKALLALRAEVDRRGVAPTDLPAVKAIWIELQRK